MISRPEMEYPISGHDIMTYRSIYLYIQVYDFHGSIYMYTQVYGISRYIMFYDSILWFMTVYVVQVKYMQVPSGKPSNSPRGAEGATMARRVPFPPSSIPAYIEQSMKLFVCLSAST